MKFMFLADNLVNSALLETAESGVVYAFPQRNITDDLDLFQPTLFNGQFVVGATKNKINFLEGATPYTATVASATYKNPQHLCVGIAAAMNAAGGGTDYSALWSNAHLFKLKKGSGTFSLTIESGADTATNILKILCGFRNENRAAAASHEADFKVIHDPEYSGADGGDFIQWDLTSAKTATCAAIVNSNMSMGGHAYVRFGATAGAATAEEIFLDSDNELMCTFFDAAQEYQFVALHLVDPRRSDKSTVGAGYFFVGNAVEPSIDWNPNAYSSNRGIASAVVNGVVSNPFLTQMITKETFSIEFGGAGLPPVDAEIFASKFAVSGLHKPIIVCLDPINEPNRESKVCYLQGVPTFQQLDGFDKRGRWSLKLDFMVIR